MLHTVYICYSTCNFLPIPQHCKINLLKFYVNYGVWLRYFNISANYSKIILSYQKPILHRILLDNKLDDKLVK